MTRDDITPCSPKLTTAERARRGRDAYLKWHKCPPGIPPKVLFQFERLINAGKTIRDLTTPGRWFLVPKRRFKKHCEINPEWSIRIRKIAFTNACKKKRLASSKRLRSRKICLNGLHPMKGHNVMKGPNGRRRCRACARIAWCGPPMTPALIDKFKKAFDEGLSLAQILHGRPMGGGPVDHSLIITTTAKFYNQRKIDPEFARLVEKHIEPAHAVANAMRYARERGVPPELDSTVIKLAKLKHKLRSIR